MSPTMLFYFFLASSIKALVNKAVFPMSWCQERPPFVFDKDSSYNFLIPFSWCGLWGFICFFFWLERFFCLFFWGEGGFEGKNLSWLVNPRCGSQHFINKYLILCLLIPTWESHVPGSPILF